MQISPCLFERDAGMLYILQLKMCCLIKTTMGEQHYEKNGSRISASIFFISKMFHCFGKLISSLSFFLKYGKKLCSHFLNSLLLNFGDGGLEASTKGLEATYGVLQNSAINKGNVKTTWNSMVQCYLPHIRKDCIARKDV